MKKTFSILLVCAMLTSAFAGCSQKAVTTEEKISDITVSENVTSDTKISDDITADIHISEPSVKTTNSAEKHQTAADNYEVQTKVSTAATAVESTKQPSHTVPSTTSPPTQEQHPVEVPTTKPHVETTSPPITTRPTAPTQPTEPAFDITYWVSYAKNYAVSIGLRLDKSAVDCWDNPIIANEKCKYLERDIKGVLNYYARNADITDVWVWYEEVAQGEYELYIGYA